MVLYAAFVAVVGGMLLKDARREQVRAGGVIFGSLVGAAVVAGWLLYVFPL
jgi:uncharacterized protein (DUF697 family)